mgnify:CR=1 FL=1
MTQYIKNNGLTVGKGNAKIDKSIGVFNITCCYDCSFCYAKKSYKQYRESRNCWDKNRDLTLADSFVNDFDLIVKKGEFKTFRFHAYGELYSLEYFNKLLTIARRNPQTYFVTFSRTKHIEASQPNIRIIDSLARDSSKHKAKIIFKGKPEPKGYFVCPATGKGSKGICGKRCNYCYSSETEAVKVAFHEH